MFLHLDPSIKNWILMITQKSYQSKEHSISFKRKKFQLLYSSFTSIFVNTHTNKPSLMQCHDINYIVNTGINNKDIEANNNWRLFIITTTYQIIPMMPILSTGSNLTVYIWSNLPVVQWIWARRDFSFTCVKEAFTSNASGYSPNLSLIFLCYLLLKMSSTQNSATFPWGSQQNH